jgi:curli biogenesis system outer membrane secretion channel CsgG
MSEAVNRALIDAIGQVHGKAIESTSLLVNLEASVSDANSEAYLSSEMYLSAVKEQTKGAVSGYSILSSEQLQDGRWAVEVSVSVAKYKRPKMAGRKRIAILPMRTARATYSVSGQRIAAEDVSRRFAEAVVARLTQTRRFTVLDREYVDEAGSERTLAGSDQVLVEEQARLGQRLVADYVLTGTIGNVEYVQHKKKMKMSGRTITTGDGYVEVGYRLIDVALQQVAFSDQLRLRLSDADLQKAGAGHSPDRLTTTLLDIAADKLTRTITDQIYPMAVISVTGRKVVIGQGGNSVKRGARYNVYKRGKKLYDPYTKEYLGREESFCCAVEIERVAPKQSYGQIVQTDVDLTEGFSPGAYVLREEVKQVARAKTAEKIEAIRKKRSEKKDVKSDDW